MFRSFMLKKKITAVMLFLLSLPALGSAQDAGLNITGKITDMNGEPLV